MLKGVHVAWRTVPPSFVVAQHLGCLPAFPCVCCRRPIRDSADLRGLRYVLRSGAFACTDALLQELSLHGIARERERGEEIFVRVLRLSTPKLKLAKRGVVERIAGETVRIGYRANLFQPA